MANYIISKNNPLYIKAAKREALTWGRKTALDLRQARPMHQPLVLEHLNSLVTEGKNTSDWVQWFIDTYGPFDSVASLGCGTGLFEKRFIDSGKIKHLTGYDISRSALQLFKKQVQQNNPETDIHYEAVDLNFVALPENTFDLVLAHTSLHHLINLEHLFEQVNKSLRMDGIFLVHDFTGPSAWQWPNITLNTANRFLEESKNLFPGLTFYPLRCPSAQGVKQHSPFESVRSAEIVDLLHHWFEADREIQTHRIAFIILNFGVKLQSGSREEAEEFVRKLLEKENSIPADSPIQSCTLWGSYRRKDVSPLEITPWSEEEIRKRIGISAWNPRGWALQLLDLLPFRKQIAIAWLNLKRKFGLY